MRKILLAALALITIAGSGFAQNLPSYVPANGLVGWWPFNGNANDESGNGNNGTVNGATLTTDRFGNAGSAYFFNSSSHILATNVANIPLGNSPRSFCLWMKSNVTIAPSNRGLFNWGTTAINKRCGFDMYGGRPYFVGENNDLFGNTPLGDNNWHLVAVTYDGGFVKIFIDGSLDTTQIKNLNTVGSDVVFGRSPMDHPLFTSYYGVMDDIGIWNRALSQQEITGLYQGVNVTTNCQDLPSNLQQGLVGYWPFCGNANDESGNGNNGTVNGATLTTDRFGNQGSAYSFQNSSISLPSTLQQSFGNQNQAQFTFSCWFKNNDSLFNNPSSSFIGGRNSNGSSYTGLGSWPSTKVVRWYINGQTTNLAELNSPLVKFENVQNWNHVVGTYQSNPIPKLRLYYNGILVDTSIGTNSWLPTNQFNIGADMFYPRFFSGFLDDIAIWNRALSPQEITQLYNQGICKTSITVTDTLLIHTGITSYNPVAYQNTLKVWPNPGNQDITIDAGNLSLMQGWKIKISNSLGQEVYPATLISQQQQTLNLSTWGGNGLYLLHLINPQGHITEVKKIVLAP